MSTCEIQAVSPQATETAPLPMSREQISERGRKKKFSVMVE